MEKNLQLRFLVQMAREFGGLLCLLVPLRMTSISTATFKNMMTRPYCSDRSIINFAVRRKYYSD
jgi:hypothetical protein